jgi:hypothetical protein
MAERKNPGTNREPTDPERAAARHPGDEQRRRAPASPRPAFGEHGRFGADDGGGERGYRGRDGFDTPPGAVSGGSYGGGGGYSQGGYNRGNYDPRVERDRYWQGRQSTGRDSAAQRPGARQDPDDGRHERDSHGSHGAHGAHGYGGHYERGDWAGGGGDWRQGYGGYGVSESGGMHEDAIIERAPDYEGLRGGYGFGGRHQDDARSEDEPWPYLEPWAVPGPHTGRGPEGYQRSVEAIREDVCERLTRHGRLDATGIRVTVEDGEVTLDGTVESRSAKRMAEDTAESVPGVRDVHNRLRIRGQERDSQGAAGRDD